MEKFANLIKMRKSKSQIKKLVVILGPTASGKTNLSLKLAKKFKGEVVSADSRQVYKGMDIGSGKVPRDPIPKFSIPNPKSQIYKPPYFYKGIRHYLLDVASPKTRFTVAQYQKLASRVIEEIFKKNKIPFLVGGTGFYIQSVIDGISLPKVKPNWKLRKKLEKKSAYELFKMLKKLDPRRAKSIDKNNPYRLIRAIEIAKSLGAVPPLSSVKPDFEVLLLGVKKPTAELKKLIRKRLLLRLKKGMIKEVENLHHSGVSWKRLEEFGLEYRYVAQYLQGKLNYNKMVDQLQKEIEHFAKRQMTWFKKDKRIKWIKSYQEAEKLVKNFLFKKTC